ncbi:hypothetical protein NQZ70_08100 [Sorangium sp. Soce836]|nr:hypothetical protein NQZ70_08100 [Sorangium sp. Soce836]
MMVPFGCVISALAESGERPRERVAKRIEAYFMVR